MILTELKHQSKFITQQEITCENEPKKFSLTIHYDLSGETEDDSLREYIECKIDVIRELLYEKIKNIPQGEQANKKMDEIYEFIENC